MKKKVKCWEIFTCNEKECPTYMVQDLGCWLVSGTHCRQEMQGKFLEKMEMCLDCVVFEENMDIAALKNTLDVVNKQFKEFRSAIIERDKELEKTSMELALGLSEAFEGLNKVASGDPRVRISEVSGSELISKLKQTVNKTAEGIDAVVSQSHEFAIGLAEHFDVLHRVSKGDLDARISESSQDELLKALGKVTNHMVESVAKEINERKKAEEALRENEEKLRNIVENSTNLFYSHTPDHVLTYLSPQVKYILGYEPEEALINWTNLISDNPANKKGLEITQRAIETGIRQPTYELEMVAKDGHKVWVEINEAPLVRDGKTIAMVGAAQDVTERKKAAEVLREKIEREDLILRSLPMAFYTAQAVDRFDGIWVSDQIDRISGFPARTFVKDQHFWVSRVHPVDRERVIKEFETVYNKGTIATEYRWQCAGGLYRWFRDQAVLIRDEQGNPKEIIGTWRDVTERKQAEEEIQKLNEELEQRVVQRTAELEAANRELESFSYSVSHDLRAPLRAIDGFSNILLKDYLDKFDNEGKRLLNIIRNNTQKMGGLINDLLALSRLGRKEIEVSYIDMDKLLGGMFDELGIDTSNGKVHFNIKPLLPARGDLGMIHQVLANLLLNAIKFTKPREEQVIEVGCYNEDSHNVYYVKDNGVGFDMQYKDKLFGVFQRLHGDGEFEGTGIGLAIVQRIIHRHGGKIWAEGKVNEGATFYFALPTKERG